MLLSLLPAIALGHVIAQTPSLDPNANETKAHRDQRMKWWREARFGMFIHWGLYAAYEGTYNGKRTPSIGEWIMHDLKIPVAEYASKAADFNPVQFNADQWVSIAKAAGMKYIVMTAKHHEGFPMYHTKTDPYNIYDATPFKREPIAEMAAACKKQGLKFGVYYSQAQDWHHAGGAAYGGHWDPAQDGDLHEYVRTIAAPQVDELITRFHPAVLWWDTSVDMSPEDIKALSAPLSKDPALITNNRLGNGVPGDTETPEQYIPATGYPGKDWETCMTMNDTWGYKSFDTNFKSTETLLHNLIDIASKGGNYLLNVGPEPTGLIPQPEVDRLAEMGKWLSKNGRSIYGTSSSPYRRLPFQGRATVKGDTLFLNVFSWPSEGLTVPYLQANVKSARVVATGEKLTVTKNSDGSFGISQPSSLDAVSTAIELSLDGPPVVNEPEIRVEPLPGGGYKLNAREVEVMGGVQLQGDGDNANIGFWTNRRDTVGWKITVPDSSAGTYSAKLDYSCEPGSDGSNVRIDVDGKPSGVSTTIAATQSWEDFHTVDLSGTLSLAPGKHTVTLVATSKPHGAVMNVRNLLLSSTITYNLVQGGRS